MLFTKNLRAEYSMSILIILLLIFISVMGIANPGIYGDNDFLLPQYYAQDMFSLILVVPLLIGSMIWTGRGSAKGYLLWTGWIVYILYFYTFYVFGVYHNALFLAYVALYGLTLYTLIGLLAKVDVNVLKAQFSEKTPVKVIAVFFIFIATLFYFLWINDVITNLAAGTIPQSVTNFETPTNIVHILDMAVLLPAVLMAGIWLWRRNPWGYALAGIILSKVVTLCGILLLSSYYLKLAGQPVFEVEALTFGVMGMISLVLLIVFLANHSGSSGTQVIQSESSETIVTSG